MGAHTSHNSSMDIPVDPNRRPIDHPKFQKRARRLQQQQAQQQAQQNKSGIGGDAHPYLPPQPRKHPEPTD